MCIRDSLSVNQRVDWSRTCLQVRIKVVRGAALLWLASASARIGGAALGAAIAVRAVLAAVAIIIC
eukprot:8531763-Alexandrium_andersonii.AAC.1